MVINEEEISKNERNEGGRVRKKEGRRKEG